MKLQLNIFEHVAGLAAIIGLSMPIVYLAFGSQSVQWVVEIAQILIYLIGLGAPVSVFIVFKGSASPQDFKVFRSLCMKWLGLLIYLMSLTIVAKALIGM